MKAHSLPTPVRSLLVPTALVASTSRKRPLQPASFACQALHRHPQLQQRATIVLLANIQRNLGCSTVRAATREVFSTRRVVRAAFLAYLAKLRPNSKAQHARHATRESTCQTFLPKSRALLARLVTCRIPKGSRRV